MPAVDLASKSIVATLATDQNMSAPIASQTRVLSTSATGSMKNARFGVWELPCVGVWESGGAPA